MTEHDSWDHIKELAGEVEAHWFKTGDDMTDEHDELEPRPDQTDTNPSADTNPSDADQNIHLNENTDADEQPVVETNEPTPITADTAQNGLSDSDKPEQPADLQNASPVMQPPVEQQDDVKPAQVNPDHTGTDAPIAAADGPGLSPAFHDPDLITDFADTAPAHASNGQSDDSEHSSQQENDEPDRVPPANQPGQQLADMMPTDEARQHRDGINSDDLLTCPTCQRRFKIGEAL